MDSDSDPESKLISLICQLIALDPERYSGLDTDSDVDTRREWKLIPIIIQIISLIKSMDLDSQRKPESELMSLVSQTISVFNSMDLDSQPKPLSKLISLVDQKLSRLRPEPQSNDLIPLVDQTLVLEPEPVLMSLIHQICSLVIPMYSKSKKLISLCPQAKVKLEQGKFRVAGEGNRGRYNKWNCFPGYWEKMRFTGEDDTHFLCRGCKGQNHEKSENAPVEIEHPLHPKHSLHLVLLKKYTRTRECYCCDENLKPFFYYCLACDFAMNISCLEKLPVLSIDQPKWHEHTLALFSRTTSLTCDVCALADSMGSFYICPPCGFVVHGRCTSLPRVIRISRHPHRISFTHSFDRGDWTCGVCRGKLDNDYGGYTCIKNGCSYAAHSKCATQTNVWDGKDLEGVPEETEEDFEPSFLRIRDGIIQHFSHQHHHLRLDVDADREYDEDKVCQACITPIYFGNFYSCMQCDYILHETCANLSRKIRHPIHPHMLTLVGGYDGVMVYEESLCSACPWVRTTGFFYVCREEPCNFKLDVQCATISEPLVHGSHMHSLFLTSKPGEQRRTCCVCENEGWSNTTDETFNCIEDCGFALCFGCATLPHKVRYKHDKHILTLSYGEETSTMTYWCEVCEGKVNAKERFYKCEEYCCVTIHIKCLIGEDLYMKPGSSFYMPDESFDFPKSVAYLPKFLDLALKKKRLVYIDIGAGEHMNVKLAPNWFLPSYPVDSKAFVVYFVDHNTSVMISYVKKPGVTFVYHPVLADENTTGEKRTPFEQLEPFPEDEGFDFLAWFVETAKLADFVVLKMNTSQVEMKFQSLLLKTGAICYVNELFLRCSNHKADCINTFETLRSRGVFVHQWWED